MILKSLRFPKNHLSFLRLSVSPCLIFAFSAFPFFSAFARPALQTESGNPGANTIYNLKVIDGSLWVFTKSALARSRPLTAGADLKSGWTVYELGTDFPRAGSTIRDSLDYADIDRAGSTWYVSTRTADEKGPLNGRLFSLNTTDNRLTENLIRWDSTAPISYLWYTSLAHDRNYRFASTATSSLLRRSLTDTVWEIVIPEKIRLPADSNSPALRYAVKDFPRPDGFTALIDSSLDTAVHPIRVPLSRSGLFASYNANQVLVDSLRPDSQMVVVATGNGLRYSRDGGEHWSRRILTPAGTGDNFSQVWLQRPDSLTHRLWARVEKCNADSSTGEPVKPDQGTDPARLVYMDNYSDSFTVYNQILRHGLSTDSSDLSYLTMLAFYGDTVLYGTADNGIMVTHGDTLDTTWNYKNHTLSSNRINALLVDPALGNPFAVFAGTADRGLSYSLDGGGTWSQVIFKTAIPGGPLSNVFAVPTVLRSDVGQVHFCYSLPASARVTIEVYDFAMRLVRTIVRNETRPGYANGGRSEDEFRDTWDGRDSYGRVVAVGVYYFKVFTNTGESAFGKVMVAQ
jgi:hypothetical protein